MFAYSELFMLVMIGYISMFKMVKKMQNSGLEMVATNKKQKQQKIKPKAAID